MDRDRGSEKVKKHKRIILICQEKINGEGDMDEELERNVS